MGTLWSHAYVWEKLSGTTLNHTWWQFFVCFLEPNPQHKEVPRLGVEYELQLPAYTTATATSDLSRVCDLHHSSGQHRILNPLSRRPGIEPTSSWILVRFVSTEPQGEILRWQFLNNKPRDLRSWSPAATPGGTQAPWREHRQELKGQPSHLSFQDSEVKSSAGPFQELPADVSFRKPLFRRL